MDVTNITPQLDHLETDLDQLEDALKPLLGNLGDIAGKLPLLDKAKLYVLATYSIESLLFSALRLSEVDAKNHAVFKELTRVRQYFEKIKKIETPEAERETTVDKQAAIRFLKADLADNAEVSKKLSEQLAKERAKAALQAKQNQKKRPAEDVSTAEARSADRPGNDTTEPQEKNSKRTRHSKSKGKS
ncbi:putative exosome-associated family protein [Phaeoacremonium minimum UCRPA7]|uniref:Exosome complex protein n=1 Tax=Phaeoacremonium minimum (strain UCR-PA7) TaxID=1286976 RepID=R8BQR5_PHAM7|nr:putative exosome-associated family protein [Phaeoacremonium minimum UCRPA7]EOO01674.1 putative exosome-associated family protein [Phaeoacremonium minimum UCRPA7]